MPKYITNRLIYLLVFIPCLMFVQCSSIPDELGNILEQAGENKQELITVLDHYSNPKDSLKLKAAIFLIKNMDGKFSYLDPAYQGLQETITYYDLDNIADEEDFENKRKELYLMLKEVDEKRFNKIPDIEYVTSELLIEQIDQAFESWDMPWSREMVNFNKFCRFVLPYKMDNEPIERNWRKNVQTDLAPLIDSLKKANASMYDVASVINQQLIGKYIAHTKASYRVSFGYSYLKQIKAGHCVQATRYITYMLRALGIPCGLEGVEFFANRSSGHNWTVIHFPDSLVPFDPAYEFKYFKTRFNAKLIDKMIPPPPTSIFTKVYRETFENQLRVNEDQYKRVLNVNMNKLDVTHEYCEVTDVNLTLDAGDKYGDVCLMTFYRFDKIRPVSLPSRIDSNNYEFSNLGRNTIYLPALYKGKGEVEPLGAPFLIDSLGQMVSLSADTDDNKTVVLKRKFPYSTRMQSYAERMRKGRFYASNALGLNDGVLLHEIHKRPTPYFHEFKVDLVNKFRYVMYVVPDSSFGAVAEIEIFADNSKEPVYGKALGTDGYDAKHMPKTVFDQNKLTFFNTDDFDTKAWVGMDFGRPIALNKIRYLPRNDLNTVEVGNEYELFYWDKEWVSLGRKIADNQFVNYMTPSNALLWLHNLSGGKEERPFTIINGEQVWW